MNILTKAKNAVGKLPVLIAACCVTSFVASSLDAAPILPTYYPEEDHLAAYLNQMPWKYYKSYYVAGLAWFWVDDAKDCVKDTIKSGKIWETYIINTIRQYVKPGDTVIDIGAHMGTISLAMSNLVGETGQVYSFEGERQFFRELYHNIYSNGKTNIKPHLCWISDKIDETIVEGFYGENYSPVHQATDTPWPLHIRTLDSFGFENVALMKIDVECTEDEVLRGAKNTIDRSRPVLIIEIMGGFGNSTKPEVLSRIKNTINTLEQMGYVVHKLWVDDYLAIPKEKAKK